MDIVNNNSVSESLLGQWSEKKTGFRQFTFSTKRRHQRTTNTHLVYLIGPALIGYISMTLAKTVSYK